jgi:hypothetical protein
LQAAGQTANVVKVVVLSAIRLAWYEFLRCVMQDKINRAATLLSTTPTEIHICARSCLIFAVFLSVMALSRSLEAQVPDEVAGVVTFEAENFGTNVTRSGHSWTLRGFIGPFSGSGYMEALPDISTQVSAVSAPSQSPELQYVFNVPTAATHFVWARFYAEDANADSLHVGIGAGPNGTVNATLTAGVNASWRWIKSAGISIGAPGNRTLHVWMAEDGLRLDRLLITTNNNLAASTGNAWHNPASAEVPGGLTMRAPLLVNAGSSVTIYNGNQFQGAGNAGSQTAAGSAIYYRKLGDSSWTSASMTPASQSANSNYFSGTIPAGAYVRGDTLLYYIKAWYSDHLPTFIFSSNGISSVSEIENDAQGNPFVFSVGPFSNAPAATTLAAGLINPDSALLRGSVNPKGAVASAWFEYGITTAYGSSSQLISSLTGTNDIAVQTVVRSLQPGTNYHFRIVASNQVGLAQGADATFATPAVSVSTLPTTDGSATSMKLWAQANPNHFDAKGWFEWGTTTNYGVTSVMQNLGSGTAGTNFGQSLTGLVAGTEYHYRAVAASGSSTNYGADWLFGLNSGNYWKHCWSG